MRGSVLLILVAILAALPLSLRVRASDPVANISCGQLEGTCNSRACCCSSTGALSQSPTEQGTCKWKASNGMAGTIFLMSAAVAPAILLACMSTLRSKGLKLTQNPPMAQV
jgi:hypothetical protein